MFKTQKKNNKKGFSLVEMLVVIAVIAILVAIIIPVVGTSNVKAAAATNAANLRSVEGQLKILRLNHPEDFNTILSTLSNGTLGQLKDGLGEVFDFLFGSGWTEAQLQERFARFDAENGVLTLYQPDIVVNNVPQAKKVKVKGTKKFDTVNVEEGTDMTVYVTEDDIRCVYIGADGSAYGIEHFADIAEDGKLNSSSVNHNGVEGDGGWCYTFGHSMNAQGICTLCGFDAGYHTCIDEKTHGIKIGNLIIGEKNEPDGLCDVCGADMNHTCVDQNPSDHACDRGCGTVLSMCDDFTPVPVDKSNHNCPVCNGNTEPHRFSGGFCIDCGRAEHLAPDDCYDSNKDHQCDYEGCGNDQVGEHKMAPISGTLKHRCNYCNGDEGDCSIIKSATHHSCSDCGRNDKHSFEESGANHVCSVCDYSEAHKNWKESSDNSHVCGICNGGKEKCNNTDKANCSRCNRKKTGSCVTPDTMITLADGSKKRVDELTGDELLLVWNMETGKLDAAPIMFVDSDPEAEFEIVHLYFSDGTDVKVIAEHGFWDYDLNRYVYLDNTAAQYIGHTFFMLSGDAGEKVTLVDVVLEVQTTTAWSPVTVGHLCYFVNDMLSMPGGVGGLFNIFDVVPETMTYDLDAMARDIELYGLFTYEELASQVELSEDMFYNAGGPYLKISIGKGNLTEAELIAMIERYSKYF